MKRFAELQLDDPNTQVLGKSMLGFIECLMKENILPILEKHSLSDIDPDSWYPLTRWIAVLREVRNSTYDLVSIGMSIIDHVPYPPGFSRLPFQDVLASLNVAYQASHKGDVGAYITEFVDNYHALIDVNVPYPDDLVYGGYWQLCRKFLPPGTQFVVNFDQSAPLRKEGGSKTLVHITWD